MKDIDALDLPLDLRYSTDHGWVRQDGELVVIGITDYAQDQLGDVVYVGLPETDCEFDANQEYGSVESVKSVSELLMPVAGTVVAVNTKLEDAPELVNDAPYSDGWLLKIRPTAPATINDLMDSGAYRAMISA